MIPIDFPEANKTYVAPSEATDDQVQPVRAFVGTAQGGACDGWPVVVIAWRPNLEELMAINTGAAIFVTLMTHQMPPHYLSTSLHAATHPA